MTTDRLCYLQDFLFQVYSMADENGKRTLCFNGGGGVGKIQCYEEQIYMLDLSEVFDVDRGEYKLKRYDTQTKKLETICFIENCYEFLVLNESVYYLEYAWQEDGRKLSLKRFSMDSKEHTLIRDDVVSFGVIDRCLYYVTEENHGITVFKYDSTSEESIPCGAFSAEGFDAKSITLLKVSFTRSDLFFVWTDDENPTSTIMNQSFEQDTLSSREIEGYIDGFASYDANSYFLVSSEKSENSELYLLNNKTEEITKISDIRGKGRLFVGSDEGAYVANDKVVYYSNEGNAQVVYHFR